MAGQSYDEIKLDLVPRAVAYIHEQKTVESIQADGNAQVLEPISYKQIFARSVQRLHELKRKRKEDEDVNGKDDEAGVVGKEAVGNVGEVKQEETKKAKSKSKLEGFEWPFQYGAYCEFDRLVGCRRILRL